MRKIITTAAAAALILDAVAIGYSRSEARITVTLPTEGAAPPTAAEEIVTGVCTFGDCPVATSAPEPPQNLATTSQPTTEESALSQVAANSQLLTEPDVEESTDLEVFSNSELLTTQKPEPEEAPDGSGRTVRCYVTAYCGCESCSEGWGSMTATGRTAREGHTVAVDPSVIPYYTQLEIDGTVYTAEDCGGGVNGYHIDVYFDSHAECEAFDTGYYNVTIL